MTKWVLNRFRKWKHLNLKVGLKLPLFEICKRQINDINRSYKNDNEASRFVQQLLLKKKKKKLIELVIKISRYMTLSFNWSNKFHSHKNIFLKKYNNIKITTFFYSIHSYRVVIFYSMFMHVKNDCIVDLLKFWTSIDWLV
jgi:hypothetical protein